jgi:hypothetical protein
MVRVPSPLAGGPSFLFSFNPAIKAAKIVT